MYNNKPYPLRAIMSGKVLILILLASSACSLAPGVSRLRPPTYPEATRLDFNEIELLEGFHTELGLNMSGAWRFESSTSVVWVSEDFEDTMNLIEGAWTDGGWGDIEMGDTGPSLKLWEKEDLRGFIFVFSHVNDNTQEALHEMSIEDMPEGETIIISHVWDTAQPLTIVELEALGWEQESSDELGIRFWVAPGSDVEERDEGVAIRGHVSGFILLPNELEYIETEIEHSMTLGEGMEILLGSMDIEPGFQYDEEKLELFTTTGGYQAGAYRYDESDSSGYVVIINAGSQYLMVRVGSAHSNVNVFELLTLPAARLMAQTIEPDN